MSLEILLDLIKEYSSEDKDLIIRAYEFASVMHKGMKRKSGEDYIIHPMWVATILAMMNADADTIAAGLLHDTVEDNDSVTIEMLSKVFNPTVSMLVDGVTKMKKLEFNNDKKMTDEANMRKIVQSITYDVRIFIIKLADRLHNMRTLEFHSREKQIENAIETMELFVPFAKLIGEYTIMLELEDLCFKYLNPKLYKEYEDMRIRLLIENRHNLDEVICSVSQMLNSNNIKHNIRLKEKGAYSLSKKIETHGSIENITDLFAIKILVDNPKTCYLVRDKIMQMYECIPEKEKDYIKVPKTNMYRSLHLSAKSPNGQIIQFQIKTFEMFKINAYGITAYWDIIKNENRLNPAQKMQDDISHYQFYNVLQLLMRSNLSNEEFNKEVKENILCKKVYVSDSFGSVFEFPIGSTIIDYVSMRYLEYLDDLVFAKVNGVIVSLDYKLQNRDKIDLILNKNFIGPKLNYVDLCHNEISKRKIKSLGNLAQK